MVVGQREIRYVEVIPQAVAIYVKACVIITVGMLTDCEAEYILRSFGIRHIMLIAYRCGAAPAIGGNIK